MRSKTFFAIGTGLVFVASAGCQAIGGFKDFEEGSAVSGGGAGGGNAGGTPGTGGLGTGGNANKGGNGPGGTGTGGTGTDTGDDGGSGSGGSPITPDPGTDCSKDGSICGDNVCVLGLCRTPCTSDDGCTTTNLCVFDPDGTGGCQVKHTCKTPNDCTSLNAGLTCAIDGYCRPSCTGSCHLGDTQVCIAGACVSQEETEYPSSWICGTNNALPGDSGYFCGGSTGTVLTPCNVTAPGVGTGVDCMTTSACAAGVTSGTCGAVGCTPGAYGCSTAGYLSQCLPDGSALGTTGGTQCETPALCTNGLKAATGGAAPTCEPPVCQATGPGSGTCTKGNASKCRTDETDFDTVDCSGATAQCNPALGVCATVAIDKYEVTRGDYNTWYQGLASPTMAPTTAYTAQCGPTHDVTPPATCTLDTPTAFISGSTNDNLPMGCVDWCDAALYCEGHNQHLCGKIDGSGGVVPSAEALSPLTGPGQSEWTNACTAAGTNGYPWGTSAQMAGQICYSANYGLPNPSYVGPVPGGYAKNCTQTIITGYAGIFDLNGNVAEWENNCGGGSCIVRGGSYKTSNTGDFGCTPGSGNQRIANATDAASDIGFRCCGDPTSGAGGAGGSSGSAGAGGNLGTTSWVNSGGIHNGGAASRSESAATFNNRKWRQWDISSFPK